MSDCIEWPGAKNEYGYGVVRYEGKNVRAHRLAFFKLHGRWPHPVCRHTCDNPPCWNQAHLIEGTHADNMHDMIERGRAVHASGEESSQARLTWTEVREIRDRYAAGGVSMRALAADYGTDSSRVSRIINKQEWREDADMES